MGVFLVIVFTLALLFLPRLSDMKDILDNFQNLSNSNKSFLSSVISSLLYSKMVLGILPTDYIDNITNTAMVSLKEFHETSQLTQNHLLSLESSSTFSLIDISLFPNNEQIALVLSDDDLLKKKYLNLENIERNAETQSISGISLPSLFYLSANFHWRNKLINYSIDELFAKMNTEAEQYRDESILLLEMISGFSIIIGGLLMLMIHRMNVYFRKVLMIITRINQDEVSFEIQKLQNIEGALAPKENDSWLSVNYRLILTAEQVTETKAKQADIHQNKKKTNISASLTDIHLSNWNSILLVMLLTLVSVLFLAGITIYSDLFIDDLQPSLQLYQQIIEARQSFNSLISHTEILSTYLKFKSLDIGFPDIKAEIVYSSYLNESNYLTAFNTKYIGLVTESHYQQELLSLYSGDLCVTFPDSYQCANQADFSISFSKGLSDILSLTLFFLQSFHSLISNTVDSSNYDSSLNNFFSQENYKSLMILSQDLPNQVFDQVTEYAHLTVHFPLDRFIDFCYVYLIVGSLVVLVLLYAGTAFIHRNYQRKIKQMNFSLFLISHAKINDDHTKHLLKQLLLY